MGTNNRNAARIVFDIETAPIDGAADFIEPASAPSNYKDAEKIAAYIAEKTASEVDRCALDVDLCRVVAIGLQVEEQPPAAFVIERAEDEADVLQTFWNTVDERHLVGFNCIAFDLPVLFRRSLYLDVKAPLHAYDLNKYRPVGITDLQMRLSYNGAIRLRGLSFYCKRFGIDVPDPLTGADIADAVKRGDWAAVRHHVQSDIEKTARLAARLNVFRLAAATAAA